MTDIRDRDARVRSMRDAAVELFAREGYAAVSTRRIAEAADCSETLIFRYFGGKRGLLQAICDQLLESTAHRANPTPVVDDVATFVEHYLRAVFGGFRQLSDELKVIYPALLSDRQLAAGFERRHDEEVGFVADRLLEFRMRGAIADDVDVASIAAAIEQLGFAVGFAMQVMFDRPRDEVDRIAREVAAVIARGMHPHTPSTS